MRAYPGIAAWQALIIWRGRAGSGHDHLSVSSVSSFYSKPSQAFCRHWHGRLSHALPLTLSLNKMSKEKNHAPQNPPGGRQHPGRKETDRTCMAFYGSRQGQGDLLLQGRCCFLKGRQASLICQTGGFLHGACSWPGGENCHLHTQLTLPLPSSFLSYLSSLPEKASRHFSKT